MSTKQSLDFSIPAEEVERETAKVVEALKERVRLPGFRPGKVPSSVVRSRFAEDIRHDVLQNLLPRALGERFEKENLNVVGEPDIKNLKFEKDEPLTFRAEFEVLPEFELGEYIGLEVVYAPPEVTDADVDRRIEAVREEKAEYVNEDPRPLADGDYAVVSIESRGGIEGKPVRQDELVLEIGGEDTVEDFSKNLRGMEPGQEKEFDVTYPGEFTEPRLAGRTVRFHCRVEGLRRKELPEINDEFAKDRGDYQNLAEFRDAVRRSIQAEREFLAQHEARNALVDQLVEAHDFDLPDVLVERQIESVIQQRLQELVAQGVDPRGLDVDWAKVRENQRERARREIKASLLLSRISERESIEVTHDDMDREIQRIARQRREPAPAVRKRLEDERQLGSVANSIRTEKTLAMLFEKSRKVAKKD